MRITNTSPTKITVIGIGGIGCRFVNEAMQKSNISSVRYAVIGRDPADWRHNSQINSIVLQATEPHEHTSRQDKWLEIAQSNEQEIRLLFDACNTVIIVANTSKSIGASITPYVAKLAKERGILCIALPYQPFVIEGRIAKHSAEAATEQIIDDADIVIPVMKQEIFENITPETSFISALDRVIKPISRTVQILLEILENAQSVNIDLSDVNTIGKESGIGLISEGINSSDTDNPVYSAYQNAIGNAASLRAQHMILHIIGNSSLSLFDVEEACKKISVELGSKISIKYGITINEGARFTKVQVIATSLQRSKIEVNTMEIPRYNEETTDEEFDVPAFMRKS